ncbi:T9SS type A sorting domain-containing protein [Flavilitoribacter nigricans]|uniref:Dockerin domain-containing protein n=1 Tax=Flavilitoribacter nigricans (strain ATCC 23147 / DSM 23189 / NBRC 102662 / NCIMB 1420 / SS-2) TaxID=1122177 RepID=A0A2D0N608_FLAN2|nr:T9SS type A sorting domain-containing protein [Flavilitoribacter nigricans]PHN03934.1 hypothetical protein CRP01_23985 [Flavilitoribacter nigricans DSM 23189 = NBRC 102662]
MKHFTMIRHGSSSWPFTKPIDNQPAFNPDSPRRQAPQQKLLAKILLLAVFLVSAGLAQAQDELPIIYLGETADDPPACNCLNNATTLADGQFSETITIESLEDEEWLITANTGFYLIDGPVPPNNPVLVPMGTAFTELEESPGTYQLSGLHVDGLGFSITVSNGSVDRTISNTCYYPNISIVNFPDEICLSSAPVTLEGSANGATGTGSFLIDGSPATIFSPQILGAGNHTITYTFDAGEGTPNDFTDPGCIQSITRQVFVNPVPSIVVNNQVNASLGADCMITLLPDQIMEGTYPCMDDYIVTIYDPSGVPLGNKVSGDYMGQILRVEITTVAGGYSGRGNVLLLDNAPPVLESCAPDTDLGTMNREVQIRSGSLAMDDATFFPTNFACFADHIDVLGQSHFYDLYTFEVDTADTFVFELDTDFGFGAALLYEGGFNMLNGPCSNYIAQPKRLAAGTGYFTGSDESIRLVAKLQAGKQYTLLTTSANGTQVGDFIWAVYSEDEGKIQDLPVTLAPVVLDLYCNDYQRVLNNPNSLNITGRPIVDDTCPDDPTLTFSDSFAGLSECDETIITRTFTITDGADNFVQCVQEIEMQQLELSDIIRPPKNVFLDCGDEFPTTDKDNPHPQVTGRPMILSTFGTTELDPKYCNLIATYTDQPRINLCAGSYQFFRRWFFYDECEMNNTQTYDQIIRVLDRTAPEVSCIAPDNNNDSQPDTLLFNTSSGSCTASFEVPMPEVSDDCSTTSVISEIVKYTEVVVVGPTGPQNQIQTEIIATIPANADSRIVSGIPVGCYWIRYTVRDACGNETEVECPICVVDTVQPVAVCDDNLIVSLGGGGVGSVYAVDIDEGSRDNCGIEKIEVRRQLNFDPENCEFIPSYFTEWGEFVEFYCCEVGDPMMVQLRITDTSGNENSCMTEIQIEDKINPSCEAPDPVTVKCADLPEDFDSANSTQMDILFGNVEVEDNCGGASIQELTPIVDLDNCGTGTITRRFGGVDAQGNETGICQQIITVRQSLNYAIKFPKDVISECGIPIPDTIELTGEGCNQIAVTVDDKIFETDENACYAIHRTYLVINACENDGVGDPVVIERNQDCINGGGESDVWLVMTDEGAFIDSDEDPTNEFPAAGTKLPACDGTTNPEGYWRSVNSMGYWMYTQIIYIVDDTEPIMAIDPMDAFCATNQQSCEGAVTVDFSVDEACSADGMNIVVIFDENNDGLLTTDITADALSGTYPNYQIEGDFPIGQHAFIVQLNDGCQNQNVTKVVFEVQDCAVIEPNCLNGLSIDLNPLPPGSDADGDGDADAAAWVVNVSDMLIGGNDDDCSGEVTYSIFRIADIEGGLTPDQSNQSIILTCDDLEPGTVPVRIYAWDQADNPVAPQPDGSTGGNNFSICETFIQVQDEDEDCNNGGVAMGMISGMVMTESEQPVMGVSLRPADYMPPMMKTKNDGSYQMGELEPSLDYQVMAELPDSYLNGVSTLDIILISKHILGLQPLGSPYRMIAADVNGSGNISTIDILLLRKLILNIETKLPGEKSWTFVDAWYEFPQPTNPWSEPIPETVVVKNLQGHRTDQNLIAIKLGDVNGSANPADAIEARSSKADCFLYANEQYLEPGEWYNIDFKNTATEPIAGFQFTLEIDTDELELSGLRHGLVRDDHTGLTYLEKGMILVSWDATEEEWVLPEEVGSEVLFGLRVKAKHGGYISDLVRISSEILEAEAYSNDYELMNVDLQFVGELPEGTNYELSQNRPNPFYDYTTIDFYLPESAPTSFKVFDANGRMVLERSMTGQSGFNQVELYGDDLPAQGIYYYRLESGQFSETKKMILMNR